MCQSPLTIEFTSRNQQIRSLWFLFYVFVTLENFKIWNLIRSLVSESLFLILGAYLGAEFILTLALSLTLAQTSVTEQERWRLCNCRMQQWLEGHSSDCFWICKPVFLHPGFQVSHAVLACWVSKCPLLLKEKH